MLKDWHLQPDHLTASVLFERTDPEALELLNKICAQDSSKSKATAVRAITSFQGEVGLAQKIYVNLYKTGVIKGFLSVRISSQYKEWLQALNDVEQYIDGKRDKELLRAKIKFLEERVDM